MDVITGLRRFPGSYQSTENAIKEIDRLRAELAAKFDEYCRNLTELAQTHKEACDAKDARIADLEAWGDGLRESLGTTISTMEEERARAERAEAELEEWEHCARYDAMMEGPRFKGWDRSQMERCRKSMEARRTALAPSPAGREG